MIYNTKEKTQRPRQNKKAEEYVFKQKSRTTLQKKFKMEWR